MNPDVINLNFDSLEFAWSFNTKIGLIVIFFFFFLIKKNFVGERICNLHSKYVIKGPSLDESSIWNIFNLNVTHFDFWCMKLIFKRTIFSFIFRKGNFSSSKRWKEGNVEGSCERFKKFFHIKYIWIIN